MSITYRKAGIEDMDILLDMRETVLRAVFDLPADTDLSVVEMESRKYYSEAISAGTHTAVLAFDGDTVAGCGAICYYRIMPSHYDPTGIRAYIMNMYTAPPYRGNGIATHVLGMLVDEAHGRGVRKITLEATGMARSIYGRFGFREMPDEMEFVTETE